ncbi:MAG TPA: hypothetical protein VM368_04230 [Flavisolibacter sp.]|nr:hypothetical protein [Flavisolibacter sp.]
MKKGMVALLIITILQACGPSNTQSGVDNDGIQIVDSNGGLADTAYHNQSATDSSIGEDRVDYSKRDTFNRQ